MITINLNYLNPDIIPISEKLLSGKRITREEGIFLMDYPYLFQIGLLGDFVRKKIAGPYAYYGNNLNINHTNICDLRCPICAFSKDEGEKGSYTMTLEQIFNKVREYKDRGVEEIHIVGGVNKEVTLKYLEDMFSGIKAIDSRLHIQALTAVEYDYISKKEGYSLSTIFKRLKEAGLGSIPGGGAEIFSPDIRNIITPEKISGERWLEVSGEAHRQGIKTNATMLYGHIESSSHRIDHMIKLRELQDETGGFQAFVPLTFHPQNTEFEERIKEKTGIYDTLRLIAVARIMLDNFPHIKALWMYIGKEFIPLALYFGADDLGSTSIEEKIVKSAGGVCENTMDGCVFDRIIISAGRVPRRVTSDYNCRV